MIATSVTLVDAVLTLLRARGSPRVLVVGISLGGFVANLHHALRNTADAYVPLLAGAAMGEVFTRGLYSRLVAPPAHEQPEKVEAVLNFEEEFRRVPRDNVYPVLGRYDEIIPFDRHRHCYGDRSVRVLARGHITGALSSRPIRDEILTRLKG